MTGQLEVASRGSGMWTVYVPLMDCPSTKASLSNYNIWVIQEPMGWRIEASFNGEKYFSVDGKWMSEKELLRYKNQRVVKDYFPSCWAAFACVEDRYAK